MLLLFFHAGTNALNVLPKAELSLSIIVFSRRKVRPPGNTHNRKRTSRAPEVRRVALTRCPFIPAQMTGGVVVVEEAEVGMV